MRQHDRITALPAALANVNHNYKVREDYEPLLEALAGLE